MSIYDYDPETGEHRGQRARDEAQAAREHVRQARVVVGLARPAEAARIVDKYLYGNFRVTGADREWVYIEGIDDHGFTLDAIIDRLASGMYYAREVVPS
jgi:hypothetical protein